MSNRCAWCGAVAIRDHLGEMMGWAVAFPPKPCGPDGHELIEE